MTSSEQNSMNVLNALMEERNRYEQWLAQLEARKGTTPPHVFERVRGDYGARLNGVLDQLAGRATELQATAGTLAERVAALYADETSLRDERAEAELRAAVGEFTLDHAREVMQRCDERIAALGAERASVGADSRQDNVRCDGYPDARVAGGKSVQSRDREGFVTVA